MSFDCAKVSNPVVVENQPEQQTPGMTSRGLHQKSGSTAWVELDPPAAERRSALAPQVQQMAVAAQTCGWRCRAADCGAAVQVTLAVNPHHTRFALRFHSLPLFTHPYRGSTARLTASGQMITPENN